ncbi:MAG: hypothetical protein PVF45_12955, partial [Anaerolineae bacterium]
MIADELYAEFPQIAREISGSCPVERVACAVVGGDHRSRHLRRYCGPGCACGYCAVAAVLIE